ncbi:MAG: efflux RND transporter periplasmic adaptor subunit [Moraxellaceae bacterium]|nr:efflux RND transporter periplasmic adaptor subunit [Moraxellaceae bacterium]
MSLAVRTTIMLVVAVVISLVFWWFLRAPEPTIIGPSSSPSSRADTRLGVRVTVVEPEAFQDRIFVSGTVIAEDEVYLRSEAAGRIIDLRLQEGTFVRKGTLLAKINDADLQAQLRRTTLNLELAQIREARQRQLLENRAISQQDYDIMLNEVNTILAEIDLIKANIAKTEVYAPFDGMVGLRNVSEGAFVSVGTQLATLQNLDRIRIDFSVPERYAASVKTRDVIQFTRQGSGDTYTAVISAIEPRIDPNTRTLSIRATASNPGRRILPGAFAQITYSLSEISDALLVPAEAIIPELGQTFVFVLRDGVAHRVAVQTGIRTDTHVQITSGLAVKDSVIVTGILQLRQGMPVRVAQ